MLNKVHVTLKSAQPNMHWYYICPWLCFHQASSIQCCWYSALTVYLLVLGSPGSRGRAGEVTGAGHGVWLEAPNWATATLITCNPWSQQSSHTGDWLIYEDLVVLGIELQTNLRRLKDHNHRLLLMPVHYYCVSNVKALVYAFNQEKALVGPSLGL